MRTNDFDASIDDAWQEFRTELAAFLRELTAADLTWIEQDPSIPEGPHGRIDIRYTRAHRVRLTLDPLTLHTSVDCYRIQIGQLRALGWRRLAGGTYILEGGHARADEMAAAIVNTFRQVWETVHPTFLRAPFLADEPPRVEPTLRAGVVPHGPEHLRALVVSMLEEVTGQRIEVDDDGDVVLPTEPPSWLRVHEDLPRLVAFAMLTDSVSDPLVAAPYIAAQPTSRDGIRVMLRQRQVFAHRVIDVTVFSGDNLRAGLADWFGFIDDDVPRIVARVRAGASVSGAQYDSPAEAEDSDPLPDTLLAVLQLDTDNAVLSPHEIAQICGYDRAEMLQLIRTCEEQYLSWAQSAEEADDPEEAQACRHEEQGWRVTTDKFRAALRVVVLPDDEPRPRMRPAG